MMCVFSLISVLHTGQPDSGCQRARTAPQQHPHSSMNESTIILIIWHGRPFLIRSNCQKLLNNNRWNIPKYFLFPKHSIWNLHIDNNWNYSWLIRREFTTADNSNLIFRMSGIVSNSGQVQSMFIHVTWVYGQKLHSMKFCDKNSRLTCERIGFSLRVVPL